MELGLTHAVTASHSLKMDRTASARRWAVSTKSGHGGDLRAWRYCQLGGWGKRRKIISREFFNPFSRKLMLYIKSLPRLLQVKLLVGNWFSGGFVLKLFVRNRKIVARPESQDFSWYGRKLRSQGEAVKQVL